MITKRHRAHLEKLRRQNYIAQRDAMIVEAYQAGATLREIGQAVGLHHNAVDLILIAHGIAKRPRNGPKP